MKIAVDTDLCEANAICMGQCPEVFRVEEDDTLTLRVTEVPPECESAVEQAIRLCPRQALKAL